MSSLNESTELTSQHDSIPIDAAPSDAGTSEDRNSVDPYDDEEDLYDDEEDDQSGYGEDEVTTNRSQTLDASASYITGESGVTPSQTTHSLRGRGVAAGTRQTSSAGDGYTGMSEEYDQTGYGSRSEAASGSFYGDYSSGYDVGGSTSYGYDDSSIRSPRSGSEMSSTFASFYYDNEYMVKVRRTLTFFRRPIYFLLFSVAGSSVVGGMCQAVRVLTKAIQLPDTASLATAQPSPAAVLEALPSPSSVGGGIPSGYPNVPEWLRDVRLSLPEVVERPVVWALERHGVPVLAEVQRASQSAVKAVVQRVQNVQEAVEMWRVSSPMIPVGVFLPLFTFGALHVAAKVMGKRHHHGDSADYDFLGSVSNYNEDTQSHSVISPDSRRRRLSGMSSGGGQSLASPTPGTADQRSGGAATNSANLHLVSSSAEYHSGSNLLGSTMPTAVQGSASGTTSINSVGIAAGHSADAAVADSGSDGLQGRLTFAPYAGIGSTALTLDLNGSNGEEEEEEGARSRSRTQAPQTARHISPAASPGLETSSSPTGGTPPEKAGEKMADADSPGLLGLSPVLASSHDGAVSPAPAIPPREAAATQRTSLPTQSPLQGDVVAAVIGAPSVAEANAVLVAASKYGCSAVVLPNTLNPAAMVATPPSLNVEYVRNVLERATALAQRRALTITAIFRAKRDAAGAVALPSFRHSQNTLYVFMPTAAEATREATEAAAVASENVYLSEGAARAGDSIPINECFYDRLAKERSQ